MWVKGEGQRFSMHFSAYPLISILAKASLLLLFLYDAHSPKFKDKTQR